jgi:formiminotetrahydrofolate cyclodeaminase
LKLDELSVREFVEELSSPKATPGGGSIAALCGVLGAALSAMVAGVTKRKKKYQDRWTSMEELLSKANRLREHLLVLVQQDTDAYQEVVAAHKLPNDTDEQRMVRREAVQASLRKAVLVPLETLRASEGLMTIAQQAAEHGDPITITDAGAAGHLAHTAAVIAADNVQTNLSLIEDERFRLECSREVEERIPRLRASVAEMEGYVSDRLKRRNEEGLGGVRG